jgi:hypothetical protein
LFEVQNNIGGRAILLECENNEKLILLYKKHGFEQLEVQGDLIQMYKIFDGANQ